MSSSDNKFSVTWPTNVVYLVKIPAHVGNRVKLEFPNGQSVVIEQPQKVEEVK